MTASSYTTRGRIRSDRRRADRNKPPKLSKKFRRCRPIGTESKFTIDHDAYLRVRDVVHAADVAQYLDERLHSHAGEKCHYTSEPLVIGIVLTATLRHELEHTAITRCLASLSPSVRYQWKLYDDWGNPVSYRSVNHQLGRMADALDKGWWASDGTWCDLRWLVGRLLTASVPTRYRGLTACAIDATAIETWGAFITSRRDVEADPEVVSAAKLEAEMYDENERPDTLDGALSDGSVQIVETDVATAKPKAKTKAAKKRGKAANRPVDPTALVGPDGRLVHTTDIDARGGYRTATQKQSGRTFVGYHLHLATAARSFSWQGDVTRGTLGDYVPPFILGLDLAPANAHAGEAGTRVLTSVANHFPDLREVLVDRGYSVLKEETFLLPARDLGLDVVMDYSKYQRAMVETAIVEKRSQRGDTDPNTVIINCGTVLHEFTPEHMLDAPVISPDDAERAKAFEFYEMRAQLFRWSINDRNESNGDVQFICPFHAGRINNDRIHTNKRVASTSVYVAVPDHAKKCCSGSALIDRATLTSLWQSVPYGTRAWFMSYRRRNVAETANSLLKTSMATLDRGFVKVMGKAKMGLLIGLLCVAVNLALANTVDTAGAPKDLTPEEKKLRAKSRRRSARHERTEQRLRAAHPKHDPTRPPGDPPPESAEDGKSAGSSTSGGPTTP